MTSRLIAVLVACMLSSLVREADAQKLDKGEPVDPGSYYFRMNPLFETSAAKYDWLNRILAIGTGHRLPDGPLYSIFEVL